MIRLILTILASMALTLPNLQAQEASKGRLYLLIDSIDHSKMQCRYRYAFQEGKRRHSGISVLQIGSRLSKFMDEDTYHSDSIGLALGNKLYPREKLHTIIYNIPKGLFAYQRWVLFDNHPEGKVTITESIAGMEHYLSEEERTIPRWTFVPDSTRSIMGKDCQLATTELHGRRWSVWFAPSMPMPHGPWLLRGLPGLVVEAYDSEREHEFLLVEVLKRPSAIGLRRSQYFKGSRQEIMKHVKRYYDNRAAYIQRIQQEAGVNSTLPKTPPATYNPIRKMTGK